MTHEVRHYSQKQLEELKRALEEEQRIDLAAAVDPDQEVDGIPIGDSLPRTHILKDQVNRVIKGTPDAKKFFEE